MESSELSKARISVNEVVEEITRHNALFTENAKELFEKIRHSQAPLITLVYCSDSRVHVTSLAKEPINYIFGIENIGNQLSTALGSVMYGVEHLHTPVLMILGHTGCGAIHASLGDYSKEKKPIRKELSAISAAKAKLGTTDEHEEALIAQDNVDFQAKEALKYFGDYVKGGNLTIIGAMIDIKGHYSGKLGKIHITNINGTPQEGRLK